MSDHEERRERLEAMLASPPLLADRGFSAGVASIAARRRKVRTGAFAVGLGGWMLLVAPALSSDTLLAIRQDLFGLASRIAGALAQTGSIAELAETVAAAATTMPTLAELVPIAIVLLSCYALISVQVRS